MQPEEKDQHELAAQPNTLTTRLVTQMLEGRRGHYRLSKKVSKKVCIRPCPRAYWQLWCLYICVHVSVACGVAKIPSISSIIGCSISQKDRTVACSLCTSLQMMAAQTAPDTFTKRMMNFFRKTMLQGCPELHSTYNNKQVPVLMGDSSFLKIHCQGQQKNNKKVFFSSPRLPITIIPENIFSQYYICASPIVPAFIQSQSFAQRCGQLIHQVKTLLATYYQFYFRQRRYLYSKSI